MWITILENGADDKYKTHQRISLMFANYINVVGRTFCYSVCDESITVYSENKVNDSSKEVSFFDGQRFYFSARVSPGRGTYRDENGKRHRMTPRRDINDVFGWLERRLQSSAKIISVSGKMLAPETVIRPSGKKMVFCQWLLSGSLEISKPLTFDSIISCGMGQGASFGLGLLKLEDK